MTLENSGGEVEDQIMETCGNGTVCSTFLTPSSMDQFYRVRIRATNDFGESSASIYLSASIGKLKKTDQFFYFNTRIIDVV